MSWATSPGWETIGTWLDGIWTGALEAFKDAAEQEEAPHCNGDDQGADDEIEHSVVSANILQKGQLNRLSVR